MDNGLWATYRTTDGCSKRTGNYILKKNNFLNEWKFTKIPIKDPLEQLKCSLHAKFEVPTSNHCGEFPTESL